MLLWFLSCTSADSGSLMKKRAYLNTGIQNSFYAQRSQEGIKYTYTNGIPNVDNPKLAARHFLNAIDRVDSLKEKYQKNLLELEKENSNDKRNSQLNLSGKKRNCNR